MIRKLLSLVVSIIFLANTIGCSNYKKISDFNQINNYNYESITAKLSDGESFTFKHGMVAGSTFIGTYKNGMRMTIPLEKIDHFKVAMHTSSGTTTFLIIGVTVLALVLAFFIIVAVASCPHISTYDGLKYTLEAEPNAGAISRSSEYTDYNLLRGIKKTIDGKLRILLENRVDEIDYNNELKLIEVDHTPGTVVIPDVEGRILSLSDISLPTAAITDTGVDLSKRWDANGEFFWDGDINKTDYPKKHPRDEIYLDFNRLESEERAVLLLTGNNTIWSAKIMSDFLQEFGSSAKKKLESLEDNPKAKDKVSDFMKKNGAWMEVSVKHKDKWLPAGYYRAVGHNAFKTQALALDLPDNADGSLTVRLRYAPLFWNIRKLALAYESDLEDIKNITELSASSAIDAKGLDIRYLLANKDDQYYKAEKGDSAEISFDSPAEMAGTERSYILKTSGYYNYIFDESKELNPFAKMIRVLKKQGIDSYSMDKYLKLRTQAGY